MGPPPSSRQVYGSDSARGSALRSFVGGKLRMDTSAVGVLLPRNTMGLSNANDAHVYRDAEMFLAGGKGWAAAPAWLTMRELAGLGSAASPLSVGPVRRCVPWWCGRRAMQREPQPGVRPHAVRSGAQPTLRLLVVSVPHVER